MIKYPEPKWGELWGVDQIGADILYNHVVKQKPEVILETGTFEAQATYVMAKAANENENNCVIYTIDYDGDPTTSFEAKDWLDLKNIRNDNLKKIQDEFKDVKVVFVEGDSRKKLTRMFKEFKISKVDLFFQDSMHFFTGILNEWLLVEPYLEKGSCAIFDDLNHPQWGNDDLGYGVDTFRDWFKLIYKDKYMYKEVSVGHGSFWVTQL